MAASQWQLNRSCVSGSLNPCHVVKGATLPSSSQLVWTSSNSWQQSGWLRQRAAAAAAAVARPSLPHQHGSYDYDEQQQWQPHNPAAEQQQQLHDMVYWEQQQAVQQQQQEHWMSPQQQHPDQKQQQQHHHNQQRSGRPQSSARSWQWLASQLELDSGSITMTKLIEDYLVQLAQPGVGPKSAAERNQPHYGSFVARLLLLLQQHMQAALQRHQQLLQQQQKQQQQQQLQEPYVPLHQISKVLWALAKLQLYPDWEQQNQNHQQQQQRRHQVPFGHQQLQKMQQQQRSAAIVAAAADLMQLHMQCAQVQQQQQQRQGRHKLIQSRLLSQAIWALAKLQYPTSAGFMQLYLAVSQPMLSHCSCKDLSNNAWALGQLQQKPDQQWLAAFCNAVAAAVDGSSQYSSSSSSEDGGGQAVAAVLLYAAELQLPMPDGWLQYVLANIVGPDPASSLQQQDAGVSLLQQMDARSLASLFGAVAKFGHVPDQATFKQLQMAAVRQLHGCNGLDTAQLLWAMASIAAAASAVSLDTSSSSSGSSGRSWNSTRGRSAAAAGAEGETAEQQQEPLQAYSTNSSGQQQQRDAGGVLLVLPGFLQGLTARLADTAQHTPAQQVVLGMWATAKLHQLTRPELPQQQQMQQQVQQQGQQRQGRQHWNLCREVLVHCISHFQAGGVLAQLNGHSLALLAWGLVLAGAGAPDDFNACQQQPQQQQGANSSSSSGASSLGNNNGSNSSSSSSRFVGLTLPSEFLKQLLACSRLSLGSATPHSQALLLSALVHMQVQPSWQWLLGFWEASEPRLGRCSSQDLAMLAEGLVRLRAKPLGSWLAAFLQASQDLMQPQQQGSAELPQGSAQQQQSIHPAKAFPASALTAVLGAVADPTWGLALQEQGSGDSSAAVTASSLPVQWTAVVQQHLLLLMPGLQLGEVALLLRAALRLGWCLDLQDSSDADSSGSGRRDSAVVQGLLEAAVRSSTSTGSSSSQHIGAECNRSAEQAIGLLQCLTAAVQLPTGVVQQQWWSEASKQLLLILSSQPEFQLQQQVPTLGFTPKQLHAGLHTLRNVLVAAPCSSSGTADIVLQCMQLLSTAAAHRAHDMEVQELLLFLRLARECLELADGSSMPHEDSPAAAHSSSSTDRAEGTSSRGSSSRRGRMSSEDMLACQATLQQLLQASLSALMRALPTCSLQDFAAGVSTLSKCGYMMRSTAVVPGDDAAAAAAGDSVLLHTAAGSSSSSSSFSSSSTPGGSQLAGTAVLVLQQHLLHLERVMLQEQTYLAQQQQQQQQLMAHADNSSSSSSYASFAAQRAAPDMVRLLAAFANCKYRPPVPVLRQMLRVVEAGMPALTPRQLSVLAAAASVLQLGFVAGPGFTQRLWQALGTVMQPPDLMQLELNSIYLQQQQQQQRPQLQLGLSGSSRHVVAGLQLLSAACSPRVVGAARSAEPALQQVSSSSCLPSLRQRVLAGRVLAAAASRSSSGAAHCSISSRALGSSGALSSVSMVSTAAELAEQDSWSCGSSSGLSSSSSSSSNGNGGSGGSSKLNLPRTSTTLSSSVGMQYSVAVLLAVKALHALSSAHSTSTSSSRSRSRSRARAEPSQANHHAYAAACSKSCRSAVGKQLPRPLAAAAFKAAATVVQHALLPSSCCSQQPMPSAPPSSCSKAQLLLLQQQQQRRQQQRVAVIVPLLRLLKPLACLIAPQDLRSFTLRVGPLLRVLEGRDKVRAWRALHAVLNAYRSGGQLRRQLMQQQQRVGAAASVQQRQQLWRTQHQQQVASPAEHVKAAAAAGLAVDGALLLKQQQLHHQVQLLPVAQQVGEAAAPAAVAADTPLTAPAVAAVAAVAVTASGSSSSSSHLAGVAAAVAMGAVVPAANCNGRSFAADHAPAAVAAAAAAEPRAVVRQHQQQQQQQRQPEQGQQPWLFDDCQLLPQLGPPTSRRPQQVQQAVVPCG